MQRVKYIILAIGLAIMPPALAAATTEAVDPGTIVAAPQKRPAFKREKIAIQAQDGGRHVMTVEIARQPGELAYGLMKVKTLPRGSEGMLFIMPQPQRQLFWMKDTKLSLDILFIASDGTITHIYPQAEPLSLDFISSPGVAKGVLEIEGGMAARWGLRAGDRLLHKDFPAPA